MKNSTPYAYGQRFQTPDGHNATSWHYPDPTDSTVVLFVQIGTPTTTGCTREEAQAALRLVDTAPELLAALKYVAGAIDRGALRIIDSEGKFAITRARAAIAKAEGNS